MFIYPLSRELKNWNINVYHQLKSRILRTFPEVDEVLQSLLENDHQLKYTFPVFDKNIQYSCHFNHLTTHISVMIRVSRVTFHFISSASSLDDTGRQQCFLWVSGSCSWLAAFLTVKNMKNSCQKPVCFTAALSSFLLPLTLLHFH